MDNGARPMRWKCAEDGCFNEKRRPKIETFAECFPRRINFGDVDGLVELNGSFCLLEWKGDGGSVKNGQMRSYLAFTRHRGNVVFIVDGNAASMEVHHFKIVWNGHCGDSTAGNLEQVKEHVRRWAKYAELLPRNTTKQPTDMSSTRS